MTRRRLRNILIFAVAAFLVYRAAIIAIHKLDLRPYLDTVSRKANKALSKKAMTKYCVECHGEPHTDFERREWLFGNSYHEILESIEKGHPAAGMAAYDTILSERKIRRIAHYLINIVEYEADKEFLLDKPEIPKTFTSRTGLEYRVDTLVCDAAIRIPWGMEFLPGGEMLITSRDGELFKHSGSGGLRTVSGVPEVYVSGQGGLLDVAVHPRFSENGWIYLSYSKSKGGSSTTAVSRGRLKDTSLIEVEEIFEALPWRSSGGFEYGSRLLFDKNEMLYITVGHRSIKNNSLQDLDNDLGKIHRLNPDGSVPGDNPFINVPGAHPTIYSYGHRNAQGLAYDPLTGTLWASEHGPRGGDEINIVGSGKNYGWPVITYGTNYNGSRISESTHMEGMEQPVHVWVPAIAPSGIALVAGDRYQQWAGDLLVASLKYDHIARLEIDSFSVVSEEPLVSRIGRVRDICTGPDGYIYFSVEGLADYAVRAGRPGCILRIVPLSGLNGSGLDNNQH